MASRVAISDRKIRFVTAISALVVGLLTTAAGAAHAAVTFKSLELSGGGKPSSLQIPGSEIRSFSLAVSHTPSGAGWGGGHYAPQSAPLLTLKVRLGKEAATVSKAALTGTHFKTAAFIWEGSGKGVAYCMSDAFISSVEIGADPIDPSVALIGIAYMKMTIKYGSQPSCTGSTVPAVQSQLLGLRGSSLLARVDCLSAPRCNGIFAVDLPSAACHGSGGKCSYTGGVRVGLPLGKLGKAQFTGNGVSFTGGVKILSSGGDRFSMGDGSVRVLKLYVPSQLSKWLSGNRHATLGTIIVVRGSNQPIVEHETLGAPATLPPGAATGGEAAPIPGEEAPKLQPQSLAITECTSPVVGTPTVVTVKGALSPPRGNAGLTLTYTPLNGPLPLPAPVVDTLSTNAAGTFEEGFDRQREGKPYSWEVVATIAAGEGFAAAQSPACAIPIP
jgi:hypothetical protein